jgi:DNA-binding transcriptional LysR family regulator
MDRLRAMATFVAVVEKGSFSAAADQLDISRTAASKLVMDLEAQLGTRLLNRTTRRVSITSAGSSYYERARRILDEVELAETEAAAQTATPRGRLRVAAPMSFGILHLAPRLKGFMDRFPDVTVDLSLNDRHVDLVEEGFDLTVRVGTLSDSSLVSRRLSTTRLSAVAAPLYLEEHGWPQCPEDLKDHACLGYAYASSQATWQFTGPDGSAHEVEVPIRLLCNNGEALLAAAASGLGIGLQPDFISHRMLQMGELVDPLPEYGGVELGIYVLFAHAQFMPLKVRTFIDYLVKSFAADTPWRPA